MDKITKMRKAMYSKNPDREDQMLDFLHRLHGSIGGVIPDIDDFMQSTCLLTKKYVGEEVVRISAAYSVNMNNATTENFSIYISDRLYLSLSVLPPKSGKLNFKTKFNELCKNEQIDVDGYICSLEKSYPDIETMLAADIAGHTNEVLELYSKIKEIRVRILEQ